MRSKHFWAVECKLTCLGGSEKGTCVCTHPDECYGARDPGFSEARFEAMTRMSRYMRNISEIAVEMESEN